MTDTLRERLEKRARDHIALANNVVPEHLQKTPSEKKSLALKRKLSRGVVNVKEVVAEDCRGCVRYPCGHDLSHCDLRSLVKRCEGCGQKVRYRVIPDVDWERCPVCEAKRK